jgi:hypothetical protein
MDYANFIKSAFLEVAPYTAETNKSYRGSKKEINKFCYQNCHSVSTCLATLFSEGSFHKRGVASMSESHVSKNIDLMAFRNNFIVIKYVFENQEIYSHSFCILAKNGYFYWCEAFQGEQYATFSVLNIHDFMIKLCDISNKYPDYESRLCGITPLNPKFEVKSNIRKYILADYPEEDKKLIRYCKKNSLAHKVALKTGY